MKADRSDPFQMPGEIEDLAKRLAACPMVSRYGPEEAGTLVHAIVDIAESCRAYLDSLLPQLADPACVGGDLENLLLDVQEEFRHILYHIHDPEFFRLVEPTHEWLRLAESPRLDKGESQDQSGR